MIYPKARKFIKGGNLTVSMRMPSSLKRELEIQAKHFGRGFSDFVREGLDQWADLHAHEMIRKEVVKR